MFHHFFFSKSVDEKFAFIMNCKDYDIAYVCITNICKMFRARDTLIYIADDLIPKNMRCRNQHSLVFQIPTASKDAYLKSFFPQTIRSWNVLPDSLISSAELSDDCVSKFTSLVRARD